ncbi:MAG: rod-binding protein [Planctomycetales bacterium]|nr:rod-binding protein [Planctomycetales bacterium]
MIPADLTSALVPLAQNADAVARSVHGTSDRDKIQEAAVEFESLFISALLKQMRETVDGDGLFPGDSTDSMGAMFDQFMGQHLAHAGGLGLSEILEEKFGG